MKGLKIVFLTNIRNKASLEDIWLCQSFKEDGNQVIITDVDYEEVLEDMADVFIMHCAWEEDATKIVEYDKQVDVVRKRLQVKGKLCFGFDGEFDAKGKQYLYHLYQKGYPVIPSFIAKEEALQYPTQRYRIKPFAGYGAMGQEVITKEQLFTKETQGYLIQPELEIISEVEYYFLGSQFQYGFEFKPRKHPIYPKPNIVQHNANDWEVVQQFANLTEKQDFLQRIDFIRLQDDTLLLLEIEDTTPYWRLEELEEKDRKIFLENYKKMVYFSLNKCTKAYK